MSEDYFEHQAKRGTTTSRIKKRTGEISIAFSIGAFPLEIHESVKNFSNKYRTASEIYSMAVSRLREDFDAGKKFLVHGPGIRKGKSVKVWLSEKASADLKYLSYRLNCFDRQVVYTAIIKWLDQERDIVKREMDKFSTDHKFP